MFKIISIFNGNIFLDVRKKQFKFWVNAYNKIYKQNIIYLENNNKPNLTNFWLCGFTHAESCFTCSVIDKSVNGGLVRLIYILSPKGNYDEMLYLAKMLNGKTHSLNSYDGYNVTVNTTRLYLVIKYFDSHPLKTKKSIVYFNWNKMYKLVINKKHLSDEGLNTIKR